MSENGQMDQLPYFQEYIDQVLKPRVSRVIDDVRSHLAEQVWAELLARVAEDQKPGSAGDPQAVAKLKAMLENTLKLRISVDLAAEFNGAPAPAATVAHIGPASGGREGVEVVDRNFPNNPLARAVGGMRKIGR
jgi:hypothetical protein